MSAEEAAAPPAAEPAAEGEEKLKPCCACPETRKSRDACIMEKGEESCSAEIEAHKQCMIQMGFKV